MLKTKKSIILPLVLGILSVCVIIGTTLAYFTDLRGAKNPINFGKIQISVDDSFSETVAIKDALPGEEVVGKVAFSKALDSESMYVRTKILFTTTSEDADIQNFVNELNSYEIDVKEYTTGDFAWSEKYGDYYYLVERTTPNEVYENATNQEIVISESIELPRELRQLDDYEQYFETINLLIEVQAIQSANVSNALANVDTLMGDLFNGYGLPQPTDPKYFLFEGDTIIGLTDEGEELTDIVIPTSYGIGDVQSTPVQTFTSHDEITYYTLDLMFDPVEYDAFDAWYTSIGRDSYDFDANGPVTYTKEVVTYTYGDTPITAIGDQVFALSTTLKSVVIPEGIESIGESAFHGCYNITSLELPSTLSNIGVDAFNGCFGLTTLSIPSTVDTIGDNAFAGCRKLVRVVNPNMLNQGAFPSTNIGFEMLTNESDFVNELSEENGYQVYTVYEDDTKQAVAGKYILGFAGTSKTHINDITADITGIYSTAFYNQDNIVEVVIPDTISDIGTIAFSNCDNIISVTIAEGITSIKNRTFSSCENLETVVLPEGILSIETYAFEDCEKLISINIPSSVTSIGNYAFQKCTVLPSVTLPEGLLTLGERAFFNCKAITSIAIPSGVQAINGATFSGCNALQNITLHNTLQSVGNVAFSGISATAKVYFLGSADEWTALNDNIDSSNTALTGATLHYITFDSSNNIVVNDANGLVTEGDDTYKVEYDNTDASKVVATITFKNNAGYTVKAVKNLTI